MIEMLINNKTDVSLTTDRNVVITPGNSYNIQNNVFDTINLHSSIGSMIITCEYGVIKSSPFGVLDVIIDKDNHTVNIIKRW